MSRSSDFAQYVANYHGMPPVDALQDMTPTRLSTSDASPATGTVTATGPWIRNCGKIGTIHAEISDTVNPTATLVVEYSNTQTAKGPEVKDTLAFDTAGQGKGSDLLTGWLFVRVRCTAIAGAGAYVTATLGTGE